MSRRSKDKHLLTVIIFKDVGEVRRFLVSSRLILWASLFLLFYIVGSISFTNRYFYARSVNKAQADRIAELSRELSKTTRSLDRSKQHIALLKDYIRENNEQGIESRSDYAELASSEIVGIENLKTRRDGSSVDVSFRIVNRLANDEPLEGYMFVIASGTDSDGFEACVYPSSPLKDGLPADHTNGHRFCIHNFMPISSTLSLDESADKPGILKILIYDRDGTFIHKKVVELTDVSWSSDGTIP